MGLALKELKEDIHAKLMNRAPFHDFERGFFKLNFTKKTILCCSYDPQISNISIYIDTPGKTFDIQIKYPVGIYMSKVNNRNPRTRCEIYSKLTIKNLNDAKHRFGVFIVNI